MTFNLDNLRVTQGHKDLAAFIKREVGKTVKPESIALVLAMQTEFRKDPEHKAARQKIRDEARRRREAALEKHLAKARELAAQLGHPVDEALAVESATVAPVQPEAPPALEQAPAEVRDIRTAPSTRPNLDDWDDPEASVEPLPTNDFGADTSQIDVMESVDAFAADGPGSSEYDEDF